MFVVASIALMALMLFILIAWYTFGSDTSLTSIYSWLVYGLVFILGSLGIIGIRFWSSAWTCKKTSK